LALLARGMGIVPDQLPTGGAQLFPMAAVLDWDHLSPGGPPQASGGPGREPDAYSRTHRQVAGTRVGDVGRTGVAEGAVSRVRRAAPADVRGPGGQYLAAGLDPYRPRAGLADRGGAGPADNGCRRALYPLVPAPWQGRAGCGRGPACPALDRAPGPADGPGLHPVGAGPVPLRRRLDPLARGLLPGHHLAGDPAVHDARAPGD